MIYSNKKYDTNKKIKEDVDKNQKGQGSEGKEYSVSNVEELLAVLEEVQDEDFVLLLKGEYDLPYNIVLPNCKVIGENKETTTVKSHGFTFQSTSNADIEISNITFDGNGIDRGDSGFIHLGTEANIHIHDCTFTNMTGEWNCHGIRISKSSIDKTIEINNCSFTGPNSIRKYGHTNASIACFHAGTYYNIDIHNNTFNHPNSGYEPLHDAKAISFFSNHGTSKIENCKAYCNEYLGEGDKNFGITESECSGAKGPKATSTQIPMDHIETETLEEEEGEW